MTDGQMLLVTVYCDTTGLYTEEEMDQDNLVELLLPRQIVEAWYNKNKTENDAQTAHELNIPLEECNFEKWINEVYTADETDGLYAFAADQGFVAVRP